MLIATHHHQHIRGNFPDFVIHFFLSAPWLFFRVSCIWAYCRSYGPLPYRITLYTMMQEKDDGEKYIFILKFLLLDLQTTEMRNG